MKRFFIFLVVLMLFVPAALADTETEIVFHGIPWGISVNELADQLRQRNISVSASDIKNDEDMVFWGSQFLSVSDDRFDTTGHKISLYYWNDPGKAKIAGHPVQELELYSHYGIADGKISLDANDSKYYLVNIWFDANDEMVVGIYDDLLTKLTTLYGNCTESTFKTSSSNYTCATWHGANNSAVILYRSVSDSSGYQFVHLIYGKTDSEQTLREVRRLVIEHEIQSVADDSTGL